MPCGFDIPCPLLYAQNTYAKERSPTRAVRPSFVRFRETQASTSSKESLMLASKHAEAYGNSNLHHRRERTFM